MQNLTPEQEQVVHHPLGCHARVLAVAGSGKSTTLCHRINYLIQSCQVPPNAMLVLMFNSLARKQFINHLDKIGLPSNLQPSVHTFHSFSFKVINEAIKSGLLPSKTQFWLSDKSEYVWGCLKRVIADLEKARRFPPEAVDPEQAMHAISLWKGSLIPPHRAGSHMQPFIPIVYAAFEEFRKSQNALTYDDFIPTSVEILENNTTFYQRFCGNIFHLIVDEYQDVNLGQQSLIELLAGEQADVMVVGDDDQTIYEWRGARPSYILKDFTQLFNGKPVLDYCLSRSFRFGPLIAQSAANVIACNTVRVEKPLIAFQSNKTGSIQLYNSGLDSCKELADQVMMLMNQENVSPKEIIILSRMFAQMDNLEAEFLFRGIPYRVDGQEPFYKRKEIAALIDYIRLAIYLDMPMSEQASQWLVNVANKPSRMLSRNLVESLANTAIKQNLSPKAILEKAVSDSSFNLSRWQTRPIYKLLDFLIELKTKLNQDAGEVFAWVVDWLDYLAYFQKYYGNGETADEKSNAVTHFIGYVKSLKLTPLQLLDHLTDLDTTCGRPEEELIVFTTIFRTKGLEYDFVVIPQCDENLLPYLKGEQMDVYDTRNIAQKTSISSALESERRLFYVAITRARKGVMIGSSTAPSRFLNEICLSNTRNAMEMVQRIASGDKDAIWDLKRNLSTKTVNPVMLSNLLHEYLPDLGMENHFADIEELALTLSPTVGEICEKGGWME